MRHRVRGRRLGRTSAHRTALGRNLLRAIVRHHRIITTTAKAKEYRPFIERIVTLSREKSLANVRRVLVHMKDRDLVAHLFDVIGPHFKARNGGYTRILRLSKNRLGDNGPRSLIEFVDLPRPEVETAPAEDAAKKPARGKAAAAK
ncbi:MAG TPA: 50S ribosomal protein L17 [Planctomycetota bacterium]|nr:50S ribosomal protein L17 [Planctomycetota bacterium]